MVEVGNLQLRHCNTLYKGAHLRELMCSESDSKEIEHLLRTYCVPHQAMPNPSKSLTIPSST